MRSDLEAVLAKLLAESEAKGSVDLDGFAESLGALAVTTDEIDMLMTRFEEQGGVLTAPEGGGGQGRLKTVLEAARAMRIELGRVPTPTEISARTGLDVASVRHALALGRTMG
jgi:hypothetical protein